jgi:MoaA/NifB/PqqE/SkfB family radical SAM enzyme
MANIGYIQLVRHCNHYCGFCSNPKSGYHTNLTEITAKIDDFVERGYFGIILTGGEPTLSPDLPEAIAYGRERGLHVRMISNGWRLAEPDFCKKVVDAGLQHVHISIYSVRTKIEQFLRGVPKPLERTLKALDNLAAEQPRINVNINCVINRYNTDHLHENVKYLCETYPFISHFVWNNLDPSLGRAATADHFTPRLCDFEHSLREAGDYLTARGKTFRVERVPLCYMTEYAHCSTETRKIVKEEERIVHFLDQKGAVRQTDWEHLYADACDECLLRPVCGGLYDRGDAYDPVELYPVFSDPMTVVRRVIDDFASDPAWTNEKREAKMAFWQTVTDEWRGEIERRSRSDAA